MKHIHEGKDKLILIFDLGNVLIPFSWDCAINRFSEKLGRSIDEIRKTFKEADYLILFYEYSTGRISTERFVDKLNELLESDLPLEIVANIWCSIFGYDREMICLLQQVSRKYRTFILSDTDALHWNYLNEIYCLEDIVAGSILSFRYGNIKSDSGAFEKILSSYRLNPEQILFIDDMEKNLRAAERAGVNKIILHSSYTETVKALRIFGVDV